MSSSLTIGFLLAAGGAVLWGLNGTLSKYLMTRYAVTPLWFSCVRQVGAGLLFLVFALLRTPRSLADVFSSWRHVGTMAMLSVTCVLIVQLGYLETIDWTNSATATVLQSINIVMVLVYVCIAHRKAPRARDIVGSLLALAGVYLLATGGNPHNLALPWQGIVWGLVNAAGGAALSIFPTRAIRTWGSFTVNAVTFLFSGAVLVAADRPWGHVPPLDAAGWWLLAASVVFGTFASFGMFLKGVTMIGPVRGTMVGTIEPLTATVSSVACLGAHFAATDLAGFAMIIAMVFLTV